MRKRTSTKQIPIYQRVIQGTTYALTGMFALGALLDSLSNSISLITPEITYILSGIIIIVWICTIIILKIKPIYWQDEKNKSISINKLKTEQHFMIVGILVLLWLPRAADIIDPEDIRIDVSYGGGTCSQNLVIKYFDIFKGIDYYVNEHNKIGSDYTDINYQYPIIVLDVVSHLNEEEAKVAPYIVVENIAMDPILDPEAYSVTNNSKSDCGVGDYPDNFAMLLSPKQAKIFGAPHRGGRLLSRMELEKKNIGFFKLSGGEREVFHVYVNYEPGYIYKFRLGLLYSYKGKQEIKWTEETLTVIAPLEAQIIDLADGGQHKGFGVVNTIPSDLDSQIQQHSMEISKYPDFNLSNLTNN